MPFDSTTFRQPKVTVLPPQGPSGPPGSGGRPQRIRIEIEIVDRRQQSPRRGYRFGTFALTLLIIALLAALTGCTAAHAQSGPTSWQSYRQGFMTRYQGNDANSGQWTGSSYKQGFMIYFDANGPNGESRHCRSWQEGWQTFTECDR